MHLKESWKLLELWSYAFKNGANVVLMRHAPKSGLNESGLTGQGADLAAEYGKILESLPCGWPKDLIFSHTNKDRSTETLKLVFRESFRSDSQNLHYSKDLDAPIVSQNVEDQVMTLHSEIGHWRGYLCTHTYYFLKDMGGDYSGSENPHTEVAERMIRGVDDLFNLNRPVIYCGHSPSIEIVCQRTLNATLGKIGGFLNPLDSIHLKKVDGKIKWIARINPIIGYEDTQSDEYFGRILP